MCCPTILIKIARQITVAELLTHTSGLGDIFGPEFEQNKDKLRAEQELRQTLSR